MDSNSKATKDMATIESPADTPTNGEPSPSPSSSSSSTTATPPTSWLPTSQLAKNTSLKNTKRLWLGLRAAQTEVNEAKLMFFYGKTFDENQVYELDKAKDLLSHPKFDLERKTVLYLHGYVETIRDESVHVILNAYLKRQDHNILILNWGSLADGNYLLDAVQNAKGLGPRIADLLLELFENGLKVPLFHLVGHSLGGQLGGMIARNVIKKSNGATRLLRLSALDPAFPSFYPAIGVTAINQKDAVMVDVIHTDAWLYGAPFSTGTVDFWPNSGKSLQPGCPKRNHKMLTDNDLCSHRRSWRFWAESVATKDPSFHAVSAKNWNDFKKGRIDESSAIQMGIGCPMTAKGDYYLQTNAQQPYSRDMAGINYEVIDNIVIDDL